VIKLFARRLRELREEKKLTQVELGEKLNISGSTISMYEQGRRMPDPDTLYKIAKFFDVSLEYLLGYSDKRKEVDITSIFDVIPVGKLLQVPVVGVVKAGPNGIAYEEFQGFEYIDAELYKDCGNCFFLRVRGDSMEPEIKENDLALVRKQPEIPSGAIGVVIINGEEGMLKKVVKKENTLILYSLNPKYEPIVLTPKDEFIVVGQVISIVRKFT
jgi:repressor LexA